MTSRIVSAVIVWCVACGTGRTQENFLEKMTFPKGSEAVFLAEGKNIRVKTPEKNPPKNIGGRPPSLWDGKSNFTMAGNFEVLVDFSINQLGPKTGRVPFEANAEIAIEGMSPKNIYGINVNAQPNDPMSFRINRFEWKPLGGTHYDIKRIPRTSNEGRIGFRREGSEIIFLAADGLDQEVKELLRLPYESKSEVDFKLSAYQGNGATLMPVDVLFSNIAIRADTMEKTVKKPGPNPSAEFGASVSFNSMLDYDKAPGRLVSDLKQGNDSVQAIRVEGRGLRVKPPSATTATKDAQTYWYRESAYDLVGDFELSARYEVGELSVPTREGYGSLSVNIGVETSGPLGSFSFGRGISRGDGQRYCLTRYSPTSNGGNWDTQAFKTSSFQGRLIIRRVGERFHFLVEEGSSGIKELFQTPAIMSTPLKFRISTDQGGTNLGIANVLLTDILVKAENILDNGKPVKPIRSPSTVPDGQDAVGPIDESLPTPPRKWLYLVLGMGVLVMLGTAGILVWRGKAQKASPSSRTGSTAAPSSAPVPSQRSDPAKAGKREAPHAPGLPAPQKGTNPPNSGKSGK